MELRTLYRDIVETSPDGIWVIDPEGRTVYANSRIAELLGRTPEEVLALSVVDVLDEDGRAQFTEHLADLRDGNLHREDVECLWMRADGETVWVLLRESRLYDADGNIAGFLHRVTDYSERRRLFQELTEAQRIAKVGSYEWDVVNDVIVASDELHAMYGVSREEFGATYDAFIELVHPADRDIVHAAVRDALGGTDSFDFEVRVRRGDGTSLWIRGRGELFRDAAGDPLRVRGTHQDVSDAKAAQAALEDLVAQNTLLQAIASAANEAATLDEVLVVGQSLLLRHDDWVRARGYLPSAESPDGVTPLYLGPEEEGADAQDVDTVAFERGLAARCLQERGQVWEEETRPDRPSIAFPVMDGEEVVAISVITEAGPFERHDMIRMMIDQVAVQLGRVAERDRAARELAAARDAAMAASQQKSEFLATMSHEIRTPLNGVIGLNDLLLRTDLDAHQQRLASGAQIASRALLTVVNDILDFSKIEAGRLEIESVVFEVRPVFDQVASLLGESARAKDLELMVSCDPRVPDFLTGDPTRLAQVLTNLGSNAVKFTDAGEVSIRANVDSMSEGDVVLRVEVADTGIGVHPEQRDRIFNPFSQADASTTRQYGGTGLGLAIASEIVAAMDGRIDVTTTPGEGATFWFTARLGEAAGPPTAADELHGHPALVGRRVLVVDDNFNNRLILSEHLHRWDVRSSEATGAEPALEVMRVAARRGEPFDAVLLDMAMPERDGLELASMIRQEEALAETPLIMLTSTSEVPRESLAGAGIDACLTKPVLAGDVLDAMLRVLVGEEVTSQAAGRRAGEQRAGARPSGERPRLLVVEDNPVNQLVALGILETLGYSAHTAEDGLEALAAWRGNSYVAILMDVQMPRMDGYDTTRVIREEEPEGTHIPVLAMTAAAVAGEREKCLAVGMDDFLTKPVSPDSLGAMLHRWLDAEENPGPTPVPEGTGLPGSELGSRSLDTERLDMLRDLDPGNTTYLDTAIANFVGRAVESVDAVSGAVAAEDHEALIFSAHRLKGSALNLGLTDVGHWAYELELLGDAGATVGAPALLENLAKSLVEGVDQLQAYQRSYQSGSAETTDPSL